MFWGDGGGLELVIHIDYLELFETKTGMVFVTGEVAVMEVRLPSALHDPVTTGSFLLGPDESEDDVPPSPTPDPATPTVGAGSFFQQGFLDCAQEALRFLVEEEGMPEDSPVVEGLKQHLLDSTSHFTPTPSQPSASSTSFTFPHEVPAVGKHHHNSENTRVTGFSRVASSQSGSARFAPYRVPFRRPGHTGEEVDKLSSVPRASVCGSSLEGGNKLPTMSVSTERLGSVLEDGLISPEDLHGVLTCLQSVKSPALHTQHLSAPHFSNLSSSSSQHKSPVCSPVSVQAHGGSRASHDGSLNDSGFSEASTTDLRDEVDGDVCAVEGNSLTVGSNMSNNSDCISVDDRLTQCGRMLDNSSDQSHRMLEAGTYSSDFDSKVSPAVRGLVSSAGTTEGTVHVFSYSHEDSDTLPASDRPSQSPSFTQTSAVSSVPTDSSHTQSSSPSSQLTLLSALSSGAHSLTAAAEDGSTTASRIQSLASQILLLLQEEAEADDGSESENDLDSDIDEGDASDSESDGDGAMLEVEP